MTTREQIHFEMRTVDDLIIDDERSFRHVALYADLKEVLRRAKYQFRVLPKGSTASWDRALLLNLTYWHAGDGGDVLVDDHLAADAVPHAAWHHLAAKALASEPGLPPSVQGLFLGEAIASAFDLYLVGRLLGHAPDSSFLATQVPAMAESARGAGLAEDDFEALLADIAREPERAFADLRELLSDATAALFGSAGAGEALAALNRLDTHRFGSLLHHYELSNWVLYAHAYGSGSGVDSRAGDIDAALRTAKVPLDWLSSAWVAPALG
jgi:hypothetical protein